MHKNRVPGCARRGNIKKYWIVALAAIALGLLAGCSSSGGSAAAAPGGTGGAPSGKGGGRRGGGGDAPVTVAPAVTKDVPVEVQVIGNVEAYSTISVRAQVTGQLIKAWFQEGDFVKKADKLYSIDPRPLQAALNQSVANNSRDQAALGQAQAALARDSAQAKYAASQADRYARLFQEKVVSRDQAEQLRANADAVNQTVQADQAAIESAKAAVGASAAAVENARVQLEYTDIKSPIDGRTGNVTVKQGNVVTANNMELCTITQVEPIYVTFAVPESQLSAIKKYMAEGKLPVRARPQDDVSATEETGTLTFVDNTVDVTTGTIKLKGTFPNGDHKLWPGQFVRVILRLTTQRNAVTVPTEAVLTGQTGPYVYVLKQDRTVDSRTVVTGARVGPDMVIESGLQAGETVVTEGQLRLAPGSKVTIRDASGRGGGAGGSRGGADAGGARGGQDGGAGGAAPADGPAGDSRKGGRKGSKDKSSQ